MDAVSIRGTKILNSVVEYLYWKAGQCENIDQLDPIKLALAICGAVRKGSPDPLIEASYQVFGRPLAVYRLHRMKEQFQQAHDLRKCINEDVVAPGSLRGSSQKGGDVHQMQSTPLPADNTMQSPSRTSETVIAKKKITAS